eukprot:TRINITY_DN562_c0_g1_i1.p1 TRINITY_DN562_c0_g1~~TRINITY_DN562_c0_g1_i1.p1  ORF type:complete len:458 (+),score=83.64 TRINITY_DN562_c0_g1_i1:54-1427(+)
MCIRDSLSMVSYAVPGSLELHEWAWILAGVSTLLACLVSLWTIYKHLRYYNEVRIQRYIVRIVLLVPIYAVNSYLALIFKTYGFYFVLARDCYESYVLFMFFRLLVELADGEANLASQLELVPQMKYSIPFCCFHIKPGRIFLHRCKQMILQFVVVKPILAIVTFILELTHKYEEGNFSPVYGYLWITILYNASITISLYFLVLFYEATKDILADFKPISKFLCIKAVIFFSFWQGVVIAGLVHFDFLIEAQGDWTQSQVAAGTQNFIICLEMFPCAIGYYLTFGYKTFKRKDVLLGSRSKAILMSFRDVANIHDVMVDTQHALQKEPERNIAILNNFLSLDRTTQQKYILQSGFIDKKGEDLAKLWKKRYVILLSEPYGMAYFKTNPFDEMGPLPKPRGFIDFAVVTGAMAKRTNVFKVLSPGRIWRFRTKTTEERDQWVKIIDHQAKHWSGVNLD